MNGRDGGFVSLIFDINRNLQYRDKNDIARHISTLPVSAVSELEKGLAEPIIILI